MLRENSLRSALRTAVGRCFGSELIANPNRISWMTGMPTIMPKVRRSRLSWMNSLPTMPNQRESENQLAFIGGPSRSCVCLRRCLHVGFAHQVDEYVLETCSDLMPLPARFGPERCQRRIESCAVGTGDMQCSAECCHLLDRLQSAQTHGQRRQISTRHRPGDQRLARDDLRRGALREQAPIEDVTQLVATLGLVHVVRADQHRDTARGKGMQLIP